MLLLFVLSWYSFHCSAQILPPQSKIQNPKSKIGPLFWADGISQLDQLDLYRETGLNTVVVRLTWPPSPDGSLEPTDLSPQRAFALAAAARGLKVIYQLPAAPFGMERALRMTADSEAYFTVWSLWVQAAIGALAETPNLIGWMLPDDPRSLPFYEDLGFGRWLAANYANIGVLNRQWNEPFSSFSSVNIAQAQALAAHWRGQSRSSEAMSIDDVKQRLETTNARASSENWTFHPASLALANYKWSAYRALVGRWAQVVKGASPKTLVFSGRLPDYAQLLALPHNVDMVVADIRPDNAEMDMATNNPQAVDIARRGGRFGALPVLATAGAMPPAMLPGLLPEWADSALAHGASGLVFSSWPGLLSNEPLRRATQSTLARLQAPPRSEVWNQSPIATTAIVLTPLADGHTRMGAMPGQERGLYGFGAEMVEGEPNNLVYALRWGTLFGGVDYLSPDDLERAAPGELSRYSTILMPQALSVSGAEAATMENYVRDGGVIVADLGLGAMQAEGQAASVPPSLASLFGIAPDMKLRALSFDLQLLQPHPLLPTWSSSGGGANSSGLTRHSVPLTSGAGPRQTAFAGPVGFPLAPINTLPGTVPLALASQVPQTIGLGLSLTFRLERATLTVHQHGRGFALFAPFQMWTRWLPGLPGFDSFHGDLFARGAAIAQGNSSLVPAPANAEGMLYPETVNLSQGVLLLNHFAPPPGTNSETPAPRTQANSAIAPDFSPPQPNPAPASTPAPPSFPVPNSLYSAVQTMGVGHFLWRGGLCVFPARGQSLPLSGRRAAPVAGLSPAETQPQSVGLHALVKPQQMTYFSLLPAQAENLEGGPLSAYVSTWTPRDAKFFLWPNSTTVLPVGDDVGVLVTSASPVRLTIYDHADDNGYRVPPLSRHRVLIADKSSDKPPVSAVVQADESGKLVLDVNGAANYIELTPMN